MKDAQCAKCGTTLDDNHCANCRSWNGPVKGVFGEDMPGSVWTGPVDLGPVGDTRLKERMVCAVVKGGEHGPRAYAQKDRVSPFAGTWICLGDGAAARAVLQACILGLLGRIGDLEWLIAGQKKQQAS